MTDRESISGSWAEFAHRPRREHESTRHAVFPRIGIFFGRKFGIRDRLSRLLHQVREALRLDLQPEAFNQHKFDKATRGMPSSTIRQTP